MKGTRPQKLLPNHPLTGRNGKVTVARLVLWEKLNGRPAFPCHWCETTLTWATVCADHLDGNPINNAPENVVASCRGCNANREDGTGHGRRDLSPKPCAYCGKPFVARRENHRRQQCCSYRCARLLAGPRGTKLVHGTVGRYKYGCHCEACRAAVAARARERRRLKAHSNAP